MDEEQSREAQLWWTLGVGLVFAITALYQSAPRRMEAQARIHASTERLPAQLNPPQALPDYPTQIKE